MFAENQERLRSLIPKALETLEGSLGDEKQAMAAAVHLLKAAGLYGLPEPSGPIHVGMQTVDVEAVSRDFQEKARLSGYDLTLEEARAYMEPRLLKLMS